MKDKVFIKIEYYCYDLSSSDRMKEEHCIGLIQENLIEFLVQDIYLTYSSLVVYICYNLSLKVLR